MSSMLRSIRLVGPECNGGYLWSLNASVLFSEESGRHVDRAPALRGLNLSGSVDKVKELRRRDPTYDFVAPEVLQARIEVNGKPPPKIEGPKLSNFWESGARPLAIGAHDVLLSPLGAKWPDIRFTTRRIPGSNIRKRESQITVPPCRLAGGAVPIRFNVRRNPHSGFTRFLHYDTKAKTVLGGRKLLIESDEDPLFTLVPEGIEIDVCMPNPFFDMLKGVESDIVESDISVRVRIEPDGEGFRARLVRVLDDNINLTTQFRDVLRALREVNAPLLAETDTRLKVPPFSWRLHLDDSGLHVKPPGQERWRIKIDPDLLTVRLETDQGTGSNRKAIARLGDSQRQSTLELVGCDKGTSLRYALTKSGASPNQLTASYHRENDNDGFGEATVVTDRAIDVNTLLDEAAERRVQPDGAERYAFLPVKQGTLQIPCADPKAKVTENAMEDAVRSAFHGNCVFRRDTFVLEVDNAADAEVSVTWQNHKATAVTLRFGSMSGSLREALWTAEESPSPERLLPTGRLDPAMLRELVAIFGPGVQPNSTLKFTQVEEPDQRNEKDAQRWELELETKGMDILWTSCTGLPLITAAPMLTIGTASAPSQLRSLMPVAVDGKLTLKTSDGGGLVEADVEPVTHEGLAWPHPEIGRGAIWGPPAVQMVSPTAPGLDYKFAPESLPSASNVNVSLRYDLPILDELFSQPTGQKPQPENEDVPPGATAGVQSLEAMNRFWAERKYQLAATRTQDARATGWTGLGGTGVNGPLDLAQPYSADAKIKFSADYRLANDTETLPLGGYSLTWEEEEEEDKGAPVDLSGEKALLGPGGEGGLALDVKGEKLVPADQPEQATLNLAGYAPAAYETEIGLADARGTSMQNAAVESPSGSAVTRASGFLRDADRGETECRSLFTHDKPRKVLGLGGEDSSVAFWVRDLPLLADGTFYGRLNPVEGRIGPDAAPFDRGALQDALYEWRFFEESNKGQPAPHTVRFHELVLAPLRLLSYQPGQRAQILFRAMLDDRAKDQDEDAPFGVEQPYAVGPLLILEFDKDEKDEKDEKKLCLEAVSAAVLNGKMLDDDQPRNGIAALNEGGNLSPAEQTITFSVDAALTLRIAGQADERKSRRIGAELTARLAIPKTGSAKVLVKPRLHFSLFGGKIALDVPCDEYGNYVFESKLKDLPTKGVWIERAHLSRTGPGTHGWALSITLGASLPLYEDGRPQVLAASNDTASWLGLANIRPDTVEIDIARGALWIVKKDPPKKSASPVAGIRFDTIDQLAYSAAIVLGPAKSGNGDNPPPTWHIACGVVQARISGRNCQDTTTANLALRSNSTYQKGKITSEVFLDRELLAMSIDNSAQSDTKKKVFAFQTSGIGWDPDAVEVARPPNRIDAATLTIEKSAPYEHLVSATLRGHAIPPDALDANGGVVFLKRSIPLTLQVRHQLVRGKTRVTWRSLDTAMLTTEKLWQQELKDLTTFGPRYVKSRAAYRDEPQSDVNAPGVGPRESMLSGFDDRKFLSGLGKAGTLLLLAGGPGLLDAGKGPQLFNMPWVAGFNVKDEMPYSFKDLMSFSGERKWKAAQLDALPFKPAADALPRKVPASTSLTGGEEIRELLSIAAGARNGETILARASTQAYFEPDPPNTEVERADWPFFLTSLIALKEALGPPDDARDVPTSWPVTSLHPAQDGRLVAIALPHESIDEFVSPPELQTEVRLLALTQSEGVLTFPLDLGAATSTLDDAAGLGSVRQAELAASRIAGPQLVGMVECEVKSKRPLRAMPIRLPDEFDEFGRETDQLFDPTHQVYASAALGWPEPVAKARPAAFAMQGTADEPVISEEAGLAARSAALSTGAAASPGLGPARYLAAQARSVFEHGKNYEKVTLPAPPARHLSLLAPRCRTPSPDAREVAMANVITQELSTVESQGQKQAHPLLRSSMGLIPPAYSRSYVGLRPGVQQTHIDTMVTDGAYCGTLDTGAAEFGRSAVMSPVMARQVRTPRSPALPDDPDFDLSTRRRTYVSLLDRHDNETERDPAKTVITRPYASAMWRLGQTDRFILDLHDVSIDPDRVIEAQETGNPFRLELAVWHAHGECLNANTTLSKLSASGFLPGGDTEGTNERSRRADLRAWLAFAGTRIDAARLHWAVPEEAETEEAKVEVKVCIDLEFSNIDMPRLLEELRTPDPNVPARLHLSFLKPEAGENNIQTVSKKGSADIRPKDDSLKHGEPVAITLPIGRKPLARPTLPYRRRTFLFADPAFDRVLSGPGKSSRILRLKSGDPSVAAMLALDRTEYDLSRTLYFAFGKLVEGKFEALSKCGRLKLRLKPKTGPDEASRVVDLALDGIDIPEKIKSNHVFAIPLGRLVSGPDDPSPKPGDRLSVEVTLKETVNGEELKHTLAVEVPIAERVDDPRPAAVYSALGISEDKSDARTILHAAAPAPDRVEFVRLLEDLASGHIRKQAIFEWRETDLIAAPEWPYCTLTKTDRAGGAQLPRKPDDISFSIGASVPRIV